ncbi:conserved Plasmodium protein, unknown function [Plasmodium knowlesi strain H]|uniref:Uncharacterized protein n=3 Tax=Plasmodium knowlesi TaxID=5850 RepID=A0A5K1VG82_PLAKH|nr:conserved Plasmodium protein, unknown function [Plasmodium knowlesi strain H]OTN67347.1 Uncharacterized protein PKNOH_S06433700 [Plasmodium knowlesi]CAA9987607.1 conserved Plasmodium protein, unknown function [Plasmodium knowlesi strain H]SBO26995.1 conserved Plasmodium protein, unknown function [Plasmodium knowlesi strain H]SBO29244.1 conserved Plasmodium protein, unknown function [Plasmodium knowlesi strain H]VVS77081.1 conserved Plasmodium protein, unknown function [Plasmodium knowlesi s|eukprot:XP_002258608.1 hypothetical protein, conserved in Plasmodium species [Plasmodium knowlesi strain H]
MQKMDGKRGHTFDILPPPLEKIKKMDKKRSPNIAKELPSNELTLEQRQRSTQPMKTIIKKMDPTPHEEVKKNNEKKKKVNNYVAQKYSNVILNKDEISAIISRNSHFKTLVESEEVSTFMGEYLKNPLIAIQKYHKDETIAQFLDCLFGYMNEKSRNIHLENLSQSFTIPRG